MTKPRPKEREVWIAVKGPEMHEEYYLNPEECDHLAEFLTEYREEGKWRAKKYILTEADR